MKKMIPMLLSLSMLFLCACQGAENPPSGETQDVTATSVPTAAVEDETTQIVLHGDSVTVDGQDAGSESAAVYISHDIIYYEDRDSYESGNPYGEGEAHERHSAGEAEAHLVVNITQPGTYRLRGELTKGQILVDLGEDAAADPNAVVVLILDGVSIQCTVAPAIVFRNVYECDGGSSEDTAQPNVDTTPAGANLILAENSINTVTGSHVAKIYWDTEDGKKLWKQDGAIYSYMSMNIFGPGSLDLTADNEGIGSELHLTIHGGDISIRSGNDGINTNADGISVTTIHGGNIHITAGLGEEGDGIDSNGYLVINGGTVVASANPKSDAGLDSDLGSFIHGGTVVALGAAMGWTEGDSTQVTMNLQFAQVQSGDSAIVVAREDGSLVFAYDPGEDALLDEHTRPYLGAVISCPDFRVGDSYRLFAGGVVTGRETYGVYDTASILAYQGGTRLGYSGTEAMGPGGSGGQRPGGGMAGQNPPQLPDNGVTPPDGFAPPEADFTIPEQPGELPQMPDGERSGPGSQRPGEVETVFYLRDKVNFFSGVTAVTVE